MFSPIDRFILQFDRGLRAVAGEVSARRVNPAIDIPEAELGAGERRHAAALMRINHCGEVCAQALYQGQSLASGNEHIKQTLEAAAVEEEDHLAWTRQRIEELGGNTSLLNPVWYVGSLAIGYAAGKLGDAWNLGFLAETETQVGKHLEGHLSRVSIKDARTRKLIAAMRSEEEGHARTARELGARELPPPFKAAMRLAARAMTSTAYWV